ncbi:MAG TPA: hemerythrin domain-containing protein [Bdellovibrionales bacterium]|nr:hemerythrin domain-containing protein [Bdellovibrionales bacterium]
MASRATSVRAAKAKTAKAKTAKKSARAKKGVRPKEPNVIDLLKHDHREVEGLFAQLEQVSHKGHQRHRHKLFSKLMEELSRHASAEEQVLYPRLRKIQALREDALESVEEHRLVRHMLTDLESSPTYWGEKWDAKLNVLKIMVERHVDEEESEIFRVLKRELAAGELIELGHMLQSAKDAFGTGAEAPSAPQAEADEIAPTPAQREQFTQRPSL